MFIPRVLLVLSDIRILPRIFYYRPRSEASEGYVFTGVCHSVIFEGGGGGQHQWSTPPLPPRDQVRTSTPPPGTRSEHLPLPPTWDLVTPPPWDLVIPPPPPGIWSQHLPPPRDQVRTSTPPPPPPGTWSLHPPPPKLHAGGRYASYWNASLLLLLIHYLCVLTLLTTLLAKLPASQLPGFNQYKSGGTEKCPNAVNRRLVARMLLVAHYGCQQLVE